MRRFVFPFALVGLLACGSAGDAGNSFPEGNGGAAGSGNGGSAGSSGNKGGGTAGAAGTLGTAGSSGAAGAADDCGGVGKVVYVVSSNDELLTFEPQMGVFTLIGKLKCPSNGAHPFSMAVNRQGLAYVLFDDAKIYLVDTTNASCTSSSFAPNQKMWSEFGMGYVSNSAGSKDETLYIIDDGTQGLATITDQGILTPIKQFDTSVGSGEVTGTGDGRLFGFFVDISDPSKTSVAEIDRTNAHVISNVKQGLPQISAWAFAFWGGSFYLFNGSDQNNSRVHKYTPGSPGTTKQVVADAGYRIVGAGVSTCAPLVEPPVK